MAIRSQRLPLGGGGDLLCGVTGGEDGIDVQALGLGAGR